LKKKNGRDEGQNLRRMVVKLIAKSHRFLKTTTHDSGGKGDRILADNNQESERERASGVGEED